MAQIPQLRASHVHDAGRIYSVRSCSHFPPWRPRLTLYVPYSLSIQPVFWNPMTQDLDITYQDLANAQAIQLVGLASSCILFIPLTKKYGRRSTYVFSTALVAASSWWTAYMKTKVELYLTSLLYGLAASTTDTSIEMSVRRTWAMTGAACTTGQEADHELYTCRSTTYSLSIRELPRMVFMP